MLASPETDPTYRLVDSFPAVLVERELVRVDAEATLEARRLGVDMGSGISELIPVDALSTAHHVLAAERVYGHDSPERAERLAGLRQDTQRLVGEWYRKLKPEYFEPVHHKYDPATEDFFSHGLSIRQMTENALVPITDKPEEEGRRVNERVEDATPAIMRRVLGKAALQGRVIRTISECTDWALQEYRDDIRLRRKYRGYGGYVPEREKVMFRDAWLDPETGDRFVEQLGLPGEYITSDIIQEALKRRNLDIDGFDKTKRHGAQILANDNLLAFAKLLDDVAGEEWNTNIFMGEEVPEKFVKDYDGFREEARRRQEKLADTVETVTYYILDLASYDVDRRQGPAMVEEFVKKLLLEIGKESVEIAAQMFDEKTVQGLQEVVRLESLGRHNEAFERMQEVELAAPGGGNCGGGSCGLESVNVHSKEGKSLLEKLQARTGDKIVKDKVRTCKNCGESDLAYAYNKKRVNTYCDGCKKLVIKEDGKQVK